MTGTHGRKNRYDQEIGRKGRGLAAAAGLGMAAILALSGCGSSTSSDPGSAATPATTASGTTPRCQLPHLNARNPSTALQGPAVRNLTGGADRQTWSIDAGDLQVSPPASGQQPVVTKQQAECAALASMDGTGRPLVSMVDESGWAVGYGRVTVSTKPSTTTTATTVVGAAGRKVTLPKVSPYTNRFAWLVVTRAQHVGFCPVSPMPGGKGVQPGKKELKKGQNSPDWRTVPTTVSPRGPMGLGSYDYDVWMIDAQSGQDALVYSEGHQPLCVPTGWVAPASSSPTEYLSVPWTLVSRSGSKVTVAAQMLPCEGDQTADLEDGYRLQVAVRGPVDPRCGVAQPVQLTVSVPSGQSLRHAATGPMPGPPGYVGSPLSTSTTTTPTSTTTVPTTEDGVVQLTQADAGHTLHVRVGTVLISPPLGTVVARGDVYRTSDPAVVTELASSAATVVRPMSEFRAATPGTATLSRPAIACGIVGAERQAKCPAPWWVKVVVS